MKVTIDIDPAVWGRMADTATARDMKVTDLAAELITRLHSFDPLEDRVILRALHGACDADIAGEFSLTNDQVARIRRKAGVPANKRPGTWVRKGKTA